MNQTIPSPHPRLCRQSSSRDKAAVAQGWAPGASLPPDTQTMPLWVEEFSWHEVGIRVQLAGLLCTLSFSKWSLTARAACIKLACVGSAFLLMHGGWTRSNQMQHKNSFIEAQVVSLVKEGGNCLSKKHHNFWNFPYTWRQGVWHSKVSAALAFK